MKPLTHRQAFTLFYESHRAPLRSEHLARLEQHLQTCRACRQQTVLYQRLQASAPKDQLQGMPDPGDAQRMFNLALRNMRIHKMTYAGQNIAWAALAVLFLFALLSVLKMAPQPPPALPGAAATERPAGDSQEPYPAQAAQTPDSEQIPAPTASGAGEAQPDGPLLEEVDLDCDGGMESIYGREAAPGETLLDVEPKLDRLIVESGLGEDAQRILVLSSDVFQGDYLSYELIPLDTCEQVVVVVVHGGIEKVVVYRWDGDQVSTVLEQSGRFLIGNHLNVEMEFIDASVARLWLTEMRFDEHAKTWILWVFEWQEDRFIEGLSLGQQYGPEEELEPGIEQQHAPGG